MAIDFTLTTAQRKLQLEARKFAKELLADARAAELLATPEERFRATKPTYEAMIAAGYLRKCIPASAGGENTGLIDMAILAEEFYSVNPSGSGSLADPARRFAGPVWATVGSVPEEEWRAIGGLLFQ